MPTPDDLTPTFRDFYRYAGVPTRLEGCEKKRYIKAFPVPDHVLLSLTTVSRFTKHSSGYSSPNPSITSTHYCLSINKTLPYSNSKQIPATNLAKTQQNPALKAHYLDNMQFSAIIFAAMGTVTAVHAGGINCKGQVLHLSTALAGSKTDDFTRQCQLCLPGRQHSHTNSRQDPRLESGNHFLQWHPHCLRRRDWQCVRFLPEPGRYRDGPTGSGTCGQLAEPWLVSDSSRSWMKGGVLMLACSTVCGSDPTDGSNDANGELTVNWVSNP